MNVALFDGVINVFSVSVVVNTEFTLVNFLPNSPFSSALHLATGYGQIKSLQIKLTPDKQKWPSIEHSP